MLIEIISHTPRWVFILFFVLLVLGYLQSKTRTVSRKKVIILPCAMIALSFYGVISAFGISAVGIISWFIGAAATTWLGLMLGSPKGIVCKDDIHSVIIPGSWIPLLLMMAIFFTKYIVGVVLARELPIAGSLQFISIVCFFYGCFSGLFLARMLVTWSALKQKT